MRHIVPVSGGKDSAAMCVLLHKRMPTAEYVFCDTGAELRETYDYLAKIEKTLGIMIVRLGAEKNFDHWLKVHKNFLPGVRARWCTFRMKIQPFENYCGDDDITSYIGIRADEAKRKGYFNAKKPNIKALYPFIDEGIDLEGVTKLLKDSGLGMPAYYRWRTRSGCYFCFFQRRYEWVKLSEEHPDLFEKACEYEERSGYAHEGKKYTWVQGMTLRELLKKKDKIVERAERKLAKKRAANAQYSMEAMLDEESDAKCGVCHV